MTKDELIEKHRDINVDYEWWDCTYADFREQMELAGLTIRNLSFSGFWSQGDGAQFAMGFHNLLELIAAAQTWLLEQWPQYEGKGEDGADAGGKVIAAIKGWCDYLMQHYEVALLSAAMKDTLSEIQIAVSTGGRYCHSGEMRLETELGKSVETEDDDTNEYAVYFEEKELLDELRLLADALYDTLEDEHEYLTADEQVWDAIVANDLHKELDEPTEEEDPCIA